MRAERGAAGWDQQRSDEDQRDGRGHEKGEAGRRLSRNDAKGEGGRRDTGERQRRKQKHTRHEDGPGGGYARRARPGRDQILVRVGRRGLRGAGVRRMKRRR